MLSASALGLPHAERLQLSPTPLRFVICQVRFPAILTTTTPAGIAPFQEAIRKEYPLARAEAEVSLLLTSGSVPQQQDARLWRFEDVNRRWAVVLGNEFIGIETRQYDRFEELRERLDRLLTVFGEMYQPSFMTRIGLRFVDEIRGDGDGPDRWRGIIEPEFLGPVMLGALASKTVQALQELQLRFDHGESVAMRHGHLPTGTTVQPGPHETAPSGSFYLLDLDASHTFEPSDGVALDKELVMEHIDRFHAALYQLFRAAITKEYAESLAITVAP
jgi:uncharacterized protein (TIGR04255 family)